MSISLWQLNTFGKEIFLAQLGGVFEHSPWVAERAWERRPFHSISELHEAMMKAVKGADEEQVTSLLRAHPDLASRVQLTVYSAAEQRGAGLNELTPEEFSVFAERNAAYTAKFGFPFIMAVRGKTKAELLAAMQERLGHTVQQERKQALLEIHRITLLRLIDLIEE
ncbi:2-oxo-4-hydroxy-4-carboxy-5-ureidoimidazoline decarboxylase [Paenibacillus montanisoli]|uniref:2-oxo-4-hydroxy-4-carboxy-5-ureidoimidazoline decarboxylase n=1 Tax=Paenibacillus montanisoli TaxID=2081970 RepID=A0A328U860_9BACL|nr:2-oxo-4-hydroxy-4-carboxy-5-ureidoimidazoline decarboxylase [Paenibacillus montanisoli]RAP78272.1 2-oxo-4-hydroxy-4-carboxy-5-ureidoimidazoline decarboxylase [Paenibacillus montanisoli]